jgi:hypothetical protein
MKSIRVFTWLLAIALAAARLPAQEAARVEELQRQLRQLQEEFARQRAQQQQQIDRLKEQIDALRAVPTNPPSVNPASNAAATAQPPAVEPARPPGSIPLLAAGKSYMNLSLDGLFAAGASTARSIDALEPGGHDPKQRGFTVQNLEATFDGAVDPFFRGQANLIFQVDSAGESRLELEEAYLTTVALPGNLQVKAGQFFTEFGRLNAMHPHTWAFVDQPLVNGRFFGPDGLRNPGGRLSWLMPTPFYSELFLAVQDSHGETAASFRNDNGGNARFGRPVSAGTVQSVGDLLFAPRYALSFDLSDTQTLLLGASAALGPNGSISSTGGRASTDTQVYGLDWFWKWKSSNQHGGFPFVSWQTEAMLRRYEVSGFSGPPGPGNPSGSLPDENLLDYGMYSQLAWGFRKGWVAALRGDYVAGRRAAFYPDPDRERRWRLSPNLTWFPSEFSKIRLQYNYDTRETLGVDHSVWLQFEFLLGSHGAHKF